ncbi:MAG TPA: 2-amino-4-hydroxy-6-hydroxymethyldihydropteridine diphosphokinase [Gammaproteobacteria bacterium]|nr:2-amino-4-hydroxy-6-hydroxymethyldihydropteridine diphosphokinase [Gammaproteobacteria bacterium]
MNECVAFIGLGSNLEHPESQVQRAIQALDGLPGSSVQAVSSLYRSAPMGPQDQPDYVNAVVQLATGLLPEELLDQLQRVEQVHGRERGQHWGPRTLDLDILLYGDAVIETECLQIPHPGLAQRNFVLYPLAEIDDHTMVPGLGSVQVLLAQCPRGDLVCLEETAHSVG